MPTEGKKTKILACIPPDANWPVVSNGVWCVFSPVSCLKEAEKSAFDFIIIFFGDVSFKSRNALVELCLTLKKSPYAKTAAVAAVMRHGHSRLMRTMADGGVDYFKIIKPEDNHPETDISELAAGISDKNQAGTVLARFCPHLHYRPITQRREMLTCGAYRDRLVLGSPRLSRFCEVGKYTDCEYFQNPHTYRKPKAVPFFKSRPLSNRKKIDRNAHESHT